MVDNQDPTKQPPPGTPADEAGGADKKVFFKKYETKEEAEKAWEERDKKFTEGQQDLATAKRELELEKQKNKLFEEKREEIRKAKTEEEKEKLEQDLEQMGKDWVEESKKGPAAMVRGLHRMFDAYVSSQGFVRRDDLKRRSDATRRQTDIFNRVRAAHKEDFDELAPKMVEIWEGLSPEIKMRPSEKLMETIYKAAKADNLPDETKLKEKIIADIKAGHGEGGGNRPPPAKEKSDVDRVIEIHKEEKVF